MQRLTKQSAAPGCIFSDNGQIVFDFGDTVPSDTTQGYCPGALFIETDQSGVAAVYVNVGTFASADFNWLNGGQDLSALNATVAEINLAADLSAQLPSVAPGVGITAGTGTIIKRSLTYEGELKILRILIDLTGLGSSTTDLDVIGVAGGPAILGRILAAEVGTVEAISMQCLEAPATGADDIILYSADEGTAAFDDGIAALTNDTVLVDPATGWAVTATRGATAVPAANQYLYLVNGEASVVGTYTAGKFLITIYGR